MAAANDNDAMVTRRAAEVPVRPVRSDAARDAAADPGHGDDREGVEELQAPAIEEAGYGYGV
jgi:hypothetical protein